MSIYDGQIASSSIEVWDQMWDPVSNTSKLLRYFNMLPKNNGGGRSLVRTLLR